MQAQANAGTSASGLQPAVPVQHDALRIELRKVEYSARLREETAALFADVWIDGVKAGQASNHDHGGSTMITPHALSQRLDDYRKTLPAETIEGDPPFVLQPDGEWLIGEALTDWILRRDLKRALRNRALYTRIDKPRLFQTKVLKPEQLQQVLTSAEIRQKWNVQVFLNTAPEDEALRLFRKFGGG